MSDAGSLLRSRRRSAGLTQEQVAELADLHVRTVRGIETGRIRAPRRATLDLLARALGLDVSAHLQLLAEWGQADLGPMTDTCPPLHIEDRSELDSALAARALESMPISVTEWISVGADRRQQCRRTEETIVALRSDVTSRSVLYDPEDVDIDITDVHLGAMENGRVIREWVDRERRGKVFEISLGRSLDAGQSHILRYEFELASVPYRDRAEGQNRAIGGFLRPPASFVLEVRFDETAVPDSCYQVFQARPTGPARRLGAVELSPDHTAHIALLHPKPGGHGIGWSW